MEHPEQCSKFRAAMTDAYLLLKDIDCRSMPDGGEHVADVMQILGASLEEDKMYPVLLKVKICRELCIASVNDGYGLPSNQLSSKVGLVEGVTYELLREMQEEGFVGAYMDTVGQDEHWKLNKLSATWLIEKEFEKHE